MIHIEDNWYVGEACYGVFIGQYAGKTKDGNIVFKNQRYYKNIQHAMIGYTAIRENTVLFEQDYELADALKALKAEYERLSKIIDRVFEDEYKQR